MIVVKVPISLDCSSASSTPVLTVKSSPSSSSIRLVSCSGVVALARRRLHRVEQPFLVEEPWAVRTSKIAKVTPPSELTSPYLAMPTISNGRDLASAATPIRSPICRSSSSATPASTTTSPSPRGHLPSTRLRGLKRSYSGAVSMPNASDGALPVSIVSPSGLRSFVLKSCTEPVATSTPSTARTCSSVPSGIGGARPTRPRS